jgi:uncharacterized protein
MFTPLWDGTARKELLMQRCSACGAFRHPPSPICQKCLSDRHEWVPASGRGSVYTFAVVRQALGRGWEEKVPYVVAVIELDEGPRFLSNVINVDPDAVQIGMPVEVTYVERTDAATLPLFQPRSA